MPFPHQVERPPASNFRAQIQIHSSYLVQSLTTLRGLVRSPSCLVRRNQTKKGECSTGTTADKDRNYIDNCSSPSPKKGFKAKSVWRLERKFHCLTFSQMVSVRAILVSSVDLLLQIESSMSGNKQPFFLLKKERSLLSKASASRTKYGLGA